MRGATARVAELARNEMNRDDTESKVDSKFLTKLMEVYIILHFPRTSKCLGCRHVFNRKRKIPHNQLFFKKFYFGALAIFFFFFFHKASIKMKMKGT